MIVYRGTQIPQLANLLIFADMPSGEIFYVSADKLPSGGQDAIRRIAVRHRTATSKTMLAGRSRRRTRRKAKSRRRAPTCGFGPGPTNQVFLLNKADGVIRVIVP